MVSALPDALDLMTLCLESGLTFERTLSRVASELQPIAPELARELTVVEAELWVGTDRKTVLDALYRRTEVEGLRDLATTIVQGERYGTSLAQSMHNIAHGERTQRAARITASPFTPSPRRIFGSSAQRAGLSAMYWRMRSRATSSRMTWS